MDEFSKEIRQGRISTLENQLELNQNAAPKDTQVVT